jgi:phytoene synthase
MNVESPSQIYQSLSRLLMKESYQRIKEGSKSFHFASLFLSPKIRRRAWFLYAWCRISDDLVDKVNSLPEAELNLALLNKELDLLYGESKLLGLDSESCKALLGIQSLKSEVGLSVTYLKDLLRGYQMDLDNFVARPLKDVLDYCYCVAGTVGLMMCQVMEIKNPSAGVHAKNLGIAMQLTNIMRDIQDDLRLGRVYIPQEFFVSQNLSVMDLRDRPNEVSVLASHYLYDLAEGYYQSGHEGLKYLPFRERLAVSIASITYRQIGVEVLKRGQHAWSSRTYTTPLQKINCAVRGLFLALKASFFATKIS